MEFLLDYGLFLAKTLTLVLALALLVALLAGIGMRNRKDPEGRVEIRRLNDHYDDVKQMMQEALLEEADFKAEQKLEKKRHKAEQKVKEQARKAAREGVEPAVEKRVFVVDFEGDLRASATRALREEITALLAVAKPSDEVVVRLESAGGLVHSYGLAASQLNRISQAGVPLTVCVDKVAASGGYMMACVADKVLAAPFAILGSIGVIAQLPNFHRLLKKHDIDFELHTAGEYKRTLTVFGHNTDKGREKFVEDLEDVHRLFKRFVSAHRAQVDVEQVATGEIWFGQQALDKALVDDLMTSDEYITHQFDAAKVYQLRYELPKKLPQKLGLAAEAAFERVFAKAWQQLSQRFY